MRPDPDVRIVIQPGRVVEPEGFFGPTFPLFSIADDGFCSGPTVLSRDGLKLNANHHEGVDRIATRSACAILLHYVKMGLMRRFKAAMALYRKMLRRRCKITVYMKGINQDEVLGAFIIRYWRLIDRPMLKMLVQLEDLMDMSNGMYPIKKRWHLLCRLVWIFEPYTKARADGSLFTMDAEQMMVLLDEMHDRILKTLFGKGKQLKPDTRFKVIKKYDGWVHVEEIGQHARYGMAHKGIEAFVSIRKGDDGKKHVVISRLSPCVTYFDTERMARLFNRMEGCVVSTGQYWGGGNNACCTPRFDGTNLSDEQILRVPRMVVDQARRRDANRLRRY